MRFLGECRTSTIRGEASSTDAGAGATSDISYQYFALRHFQGRRLTRRHNTCGEKEVYHIQVIVYFLSFCFQGLVYKEVREESSVLLSVFIRPE